MLFGFYENVVKAQNASVYDDKMFQNYRNFYQLIRLNSVQSLLVSSWIMYIILYLY